MAGASYVPPEISIKSTPASARATMFRSGVYLETPNLPATNGYEASATVQELGPGVSGFACESVGYPVRASTR
ncbi:MAG: hypothetical protein APF80_01180 [Alphaproteobacteria bacterium BRH_c36]|nr:MAG: hypothetical protein APF80_01180 [Alphaproteobacteria bacterium BRH_c36]